MSAEAIEAIGIWIVLPICVVVAFVAVMWADRK